MAAVTLLSLPAQAFWFTFVGGVAGAWAGVQLSQLVTAANANTVETSAIQLPTLVPTLAAVPIPVAVAEAATLYTSTPIPTRTPVPTPTPRPILPGPQPDRNPAVSPFVPARR